MLLRCDCDARALLHCLYASVADVAAAATLQTPCVFLRPSMPARTDPGAHACRRTKNNPVLLGESGVGKTAVVEGLCHRIADGDVPDSLRDVVVVSLDIGVMMAGEGHCLGPGPLPWLCRSTS
jgi:hypothetical protein